MHRHSHARTLMFANAASVLTQAVVRILKGGFKSEVQHLQPCKVRRCKAPQDTTSNFSLKSA